MKVGGPLIRTLPPVSVPAAVFLPALSRMAVSLVLAVVMFSLTVRSPLKVSMRMSPLAVMPVGLTDPMVSAPAFTKPRLPSLVVLSPPASVPTLLPVLVSVKLPVPCNPKPVAVMAADWVTAPVACKLMLLIEVRDPLTAMLLPNSVIGPAMLVAEPMVICPVLLACPIVKPVIPDE